MLSNTLRLNFYCLNIVLSLYQRYHSKNNRTFSKKLSKRTSVRVHDITQLIIMKNEEENKSHNNRYDINRHILDEDINTNIGNIKCLSCQYDNTHMY